MIKPTKNDTVRVKGRRRRGSAREGERQTDRERGKEREGGETDRERGKERERGGERQIEREGKREKETDR